MLPRQRIPSHEPLEENRPLRRQPDDHNFGSLIYLAVTAGAFLLVTWVATRRFFPPPRSSNALKIGWQRHVLASSGYLELGMLNDAGLALEEIKPKDRTRTEVLRARVALAARQVPSKRWTMLDEQE